MLTGTLKRTLIFVSLLWLSFGARAASLIVPRTNLDYWNSPQTIDDNNCYNYATNRVTGGFAQPGEASDRKFASITCADLYAAASSDLGLEPTSFFPFHGDSEETLIALVVSPDWDFHWYRRDKSGLWTHKRGHTAAVDLDDEQARIVSPETAARGAYTDFCGYFRIRNYLYSEHEQNGGYVRIGSMTELPPLPSNWIAFPRAPRALAEVELLLYSGRPNPTISFQAALRSGSFRRLLRQVAGPVAQGLRTAAVDPDVKRDWQRARLGDRGVSLRDPMGIDLPRGVTVFLGQFPGIVVRLRDKTYFVGDTDSVATHEALEAFLSGAVAPSP